MLCCRGRCATHIRYNYPDEAERRELVVAHIKESKILKENLRQSKEAALVKIYKKKYDSVEALETARAEAEEI